MSAGVYNFCMDQGSTFRRTITYKNSDGSYYNLTNYGARMQIRQSIASTTTIWSGSTDIGGLSISDAESGSILLDIPAATSSLFDFNEAKYDLEIYSGSADNEYVLRILQGTIKLSKEVTR